MNRFISIKSALSDCCQEFEKKKILKLPLISISSQNGQITICVDEIIKKVPFSSQTNAKTASAT